MMVVAAAAAAAAIGSVCSLLKDLIESPHDKVDVKPFSRGFANPVARKTLVDSPWLL